MKNYSVYADLSVLGKQKTEIKDLFTQDELRVDKFSRSFGGIYYDFSKNNIDDKIWQGLLQLTTESKLKDKIHDMFAAHKINHTENRAVLHTALRAKRDSSVILDGHNVVSDVYEQLDKMQAFCNKIHSGAHVGFTGKKITHIVNIGIGGSDLGPVFVTAALEPYKVKGMSIDFLSSVDGYALNSVLGKVDVETTLFVIASKTFTTQETITNANSVRAWFLEQTNNNEQAIAKHFVALSTNIDAVVKFGIDIDNIFAFWDFVGGRYSLCSAIGLSIALYLGFDNYRELLDGARNMDEHFYQSEFKDNLPVIMALIGIWHVNFCHYNALVISPYNTRLTKFPAYIQQLEMESNGKSIDNQNERIDYATCPVIFGDSGINAQHAYYQLLHQGTQIVPMDIIVAVSDKFSNKTHNDILLANAFAQAEAFMNGLDYTGVLEKLLAQGIDESQAQVLAKHKVFEGNRPTNTLLLKEINPFILGELIALYEHKTFVQGVIWNINSFDQMGVELGKVLANVILSDIKDFEHVKSHDNSTFKLIQTYIDGLKS